MIVDLNRGPFFISDARGRQELRYQPVITRQQGIQRLRDALRATVQPATQDVLSAGGSRSTPSLRGGQRPAQPVPARRGAPLNPRRARWTQSCSLTAPGSAGR